MPATELVAPMPPSAPADHLACSEKPSASWRQRGGLAACGAALVFLASIHGDRGSGEKPCAAIGQGAAGRDDARGRPAAFRSAARPAAPGALMPTTAGFVKERKKENTQPKGGMGERHAATTGFVVDEDSPFVCGPCSGPLARRPGTWRPHTAPRPRLAGQNRRHRIGTLDGAPGLAEGGLGGAGWLGCPPPAVRQASGVGETI